MGRTRSQSSSQFQGVEQGQEPITLTLQGAPRGRVERKEILNFDHNRRG